MIIQRYLPIDPDSLEEFGNYEEFRRYNFYWFKGENKFGIVPNYSNQVNEFRAGILVTNDILILNPSPTYPTISREHVSHGYIDGSEIVNNVGDVNELISFIQRNETTHMYISLGNQDIVGPKILTFSATPPCEEYLYSKGKIMEVRLKPEIVKKVHSR